VVNRSVLFGAPCFNKATYSVVNHVVLFGASCSYLADNEFYNVLLPVCAVAVVWTDTTIYVSIPRDIVLFCCYARCALPVLSRRL
jgi:hypothetical protein